MIQPRTANREQRTAVRLLTACWTAIGMALGLLVIRLDELPATVPVFVSLTGAPTRWEPTSFATVARVPLMGAGQLLAVTALIYGSMASPRWLRFFYWMALAITVKTVVESVMLAGTGTSWGESTALGLHVFTILTVVAFVIYAVASWRRGLLADVPDLPGAAARVTVGLGLALWLACATIPYWG